MERIGSLSVEQVPVRSLTPHPRNARRGDVEAIAASLDAHGQYRPLVVQRSTAHVLAGNHTLQAAIRLGWREVAVTFVDVDDEQATRILLTDNATVDAATYDDQRLADLLSELRDSSDGLAGSGFDDDAVDRLLASLDPEPLSDVSDLSRFDQRSCPICGGTWHEEGGEVVIDDG